MKIVVGYDGSAHARRALDRAALLAGPRGSVSVVHVESPRERHGPPPEIGDIVAQLLARGVDARLVELTGDPADEIAGEAEQTGADLVVVGSRGLTRAARLLLGSVGARVVHHAGCDVLVVR